MIPFPTHLKKCAFGLALFVAGGLAACGEGPAPLVAVLPTPTAPSVATSVPAVTAEPLPPAAEIVATPQPVDPSAPAATPEVPSRAATPSPITLPSETQMGSKTVWQPSPGTTWQWQLSGDIDTSFDVDMYDIDLFEAPQEIIDELKSDGRVVVCYFSAGSWEDWRSDADQFPDSVKGKDNGWPGELWLDIRQLEVIQPLMAVRLDLAVTKKCDGVEPDNVAAYDGDTGFPLDYEDQLAYNLWLAEEAHRRGLSIGLKNNPQQIPDLLPHFDWSLSEECFQYDECEPYSAFVKAGKAVFGVEYAGDPVVFCPMANAMDFDWLKKGMDLDASRTACR